MKILDKYLSDLEDRVANLEASLEIYKNSPPYWKLDWQYDRLMGGKLELQLAITCLKKMRRQGDCEDSICEYCMNADKHLFGDVYFNDDNWLVQSSSDKFDGIKPPYCMFCGGKLSDDEEKPDHDKLENTSETALRKSQECETAFVDEFELPKPNKYRIVYHKRNTGGGGTGYCGFDRGYLELDHDICENDLRELEMDMYKRNGKEIEIINVIKFMGGGK